MRQALELWLDGWSRCLAEMNYLRTGYFSEGLLDVHLVTDDEIARRHQLRGQDRGRHRPRRGRCQLGPDRRLPST